MTANGAEPMPAAAVPVLDLDRTPGHLIRRAQRVHGALWARQVGAEPTGPQFAVLSGISRRPGLDQTTVGALASLDASSTADIVRRLARRGWVTADPDPADRRRKVLHLTGPARARLRELTARAALVQQALLAPLPGEQRGQFVTDLATVAYEGDPPPRRREGPDDLGLESSTAPGHLIRRAQQVHTASWTRHFGGTLTGPQYAVLCALARHEPSDQATLGDAAALDKSSVAEVVDRLASRELITVLADAGDRRRKALRLSVVAREALPAMTRAATEVQVELLAPLPASAHRRLLDALGAIAHPDASPGT
ncbi:MarR family transcriptional regulator [Geodermatophilus sabuli]|uniref:MarR family transcriptional regulator n=1 Tax=Geodermatophilus sabuli TaxID=1564158 RepID=A0A7K3VVQ3_9ACTN|nr:MarR family transcriptional regulator [Geodermatophilus sabuli]NEK56706.1 MarR family transcriptional regulator [Geodermatophilus sabuli]